MSRRLLQRYLPRPESLRKRRPLGLPKRFIGDPTLWALSRRGVANAVSVGLFCALLPIPMQMALAAIGAYWWRANLPLAASLVWITNPLTMPLIFYGNYRVGAWLLGDKPRMAPASLTTEWVTDRLIDILPALMLGSLAVALTAATFSNVAVRLIWRWQVSRNWRKRAQKRKAKKRQGTPAHKK
ncbi:DUF2062 domain-containing protein [Halomonas halocynthiae]|uniref:DUF2062 domain-containing protein n=1 Tax=Halomonas halocynthiae TaxID=176290 RepID=UPI000489ADEF|nr:DUF2062 domain-containing protein [Halomonas halocynthiae]